MDDKRIEALEMRVAKLEEATKRQDANLLYATYLSDEQRIAVLEKVAALAETLKSRQPQQPQ